jgi:hypothetical protein
MTSSRYRTRARWIAALELRHGHARAGRGPSRLRRSGAGAEELLDDAEVLLRPELRERAVQHRLGPARRYACSGSSRAPRCRSLRSRRLHAARRASRPAPSTARARDGDRRCLQPRTATPFDGWASCAAKSFSPRSANRSCTASAASSGGTLRAVVTRTPASSTLSRQLAERLPPYSGATRRSAQRSTAWWGTRLTLRARTAHRPSRRSGSRVVPPRGTLRARTHPASRKSCAVGGDVGGDPATLVGAGGARGDFDIHRRSLRAGRGACPGCVRQSNVSSFSSIAPMCLVVGCRRRRARRAEGAAHLTVASWFRTWSRDHAASAAESTSSVPEVQLR